MHKVYPCRCRCRCSKNTFLRFYVPCPSLSKNSVPVISGLLPFDPPSLWPSPGWWCGDGRGNKRFLWFGPGGLRSCCLDAVDVVGFDLAVGPLGEVFP